MSTPVTRIWVRGAYRTIRNPDEHFPKSTRLLDSYLWHNDAAKCFLKGEGGWYKILKCGRMYYVGRALQDFSLTVWLKIAKDDEFTGHTPYIPY